MNPNTSKMFEGGYMQLVVQSGAEPGKTYDVVLGGKLSIGRQSSNQIVVSDEQVSRKHAEIELNASGVQVTDLNSSNGTFVNGTRINSPIILKPGDTLQVGTTVLKLVDNQAASRTVPPGSFETIPASDYRNQAYGGAGDSGAVPANPPAYGGAAASNPGYAAAPDYGSYNQPAPQPAQPYSPQQNYSQPQANYNQPPVQPDYGQAPPQPDYGQMNYGQPPAQPQGYGNYNQPAPGQYGQPPYGQPGPGGYAPQQAVQPARKKGGFPLIPVIGGVLLLIILAVVAFVLLSGGGSTGALPDPTNGTKIELSSADQTALAKEFKDTRYAFFSSKDSVTTLESFYKDKMAAKGYKLDSRSVAGRQLVFINGDKAALVLLNKLDKQSIDLLNSVASSFQNKLKEGDTLVGLAEGKTSDITS